ncbi:META domain-containing protein [Thauera butanivorans]|jgi:heat shock protein HslJ/membrane-bound inhibitor of C-type lysozyme|uniref:META domain-containing protein n=1 Tax=Thauera butanivorans TaxID=86174 RepID=UPI0008386349|nr:META domain-containing protein [Thauera butanivorans]
MSLVRNVSVCVLSSLSVSACGLFGGKAATAGPAEPAPAVQRMAAATSQEESWRCGDTVVTLRRLGDGASLNAGGRSWALRQEIAASGVKLVAVDDERTVFWSKGDAAMLELAGVSQPECRLIVEDRLFRAVGNEPSWRLDVTTRALILLTDWGETRVVAPGPLVEEAGGVRHYRADTLDGELSATVVDRPCVDSMSGMPHPAEVEVGWQGQTLKGCGGDPAQLLQGEPWQVVEIDGRRVADPQRVTLAFGGDGRVFGIAACNRYSGSYALSGEGLKLSQLAGTKMACAPALMDEEQRFHAALAIVDGFGIAADGSLELKSAERAIVRARRD